MNGGWPVKPPKRVLRGSERRIEPKQLLPPPRAGAENDCIGDAFRLVNWLSDMDSNHDKSLQRALCYHYTIGQTATKITPRRLRSKFQVSMFKVTLVLRVARGTALPIHRDRPTSVGCISPVWCWFKPDRNDWDVIRNYFFWSCGGFRMNRMRFYPAHPVHPVKVVRRSPTVARQSLATTWTARSVQTSSRRTRS